jgi:hypothetical protein
MTACYSIIESMSPLYLVNIAAITYTGHDSALRVHWATDKVCNWTTKVRWHQSLMTLNSEFHLQWGHHDHRHADWRLSEQVLHGGASLWRQKCKVTSYPYCINWFHGLLQQTDTTEVHVTVLRAATSNPVFAQELFEFSTEMQTGVVLGTISVSHFLYLIPVVSWYQHNHANRFCLHDWHVKNIIW